MSDCEQKNHFVKRIYCIFLVLWTYLAGGDFIAKYSLSDKGK
jgi:hypothetical protein